MAAYDITCLAFLPEMFSLNLEQQFDLSMWEAFYSTVSRRLQNSATLMAAKDRGPFRLKEPSAV